MDSRFIIHEYSHSLSGLSGQEGNKKKKKNWIRHWPLSRKKWIKPGFRGISSPELGGESDSFAMVSYLNFSIRHKKNEMMNITRKTETITKIEENCKRDYLDYRERRWWQKFRGETRERVRKVSFAHFKASWRNWIMIIYFWAIQRGENGNAQKGDKYCSSKIYIFYIFFR